VPWRLLDGSEASSRSNRDMNRGRSQKSASHIARSWGGPLQPCGRCKHPEGRVWRRLRRSVTVPQLGSHSPGGMLRGARKECVVWRLCSQTEAVGRHSGKRVISPWHFAPTPDRSVALFPCFLSPAERYQRITFTWSMSASTDRDPAILATN
jgi:hypothetical protein